MQVPSTVQFKNLYIHLPYCKVHCHYCDFFVIPVRLAEHEKMRQLLHDEISLWRENLRANLNTIYIGGGTPSETPASHLAKVLAPLATQIEQLKEFTLEANPSSVTTENIAQWKNVGVNRLSIGVQSLSDPVLKTLGRNHNRAEAVAAIELACNSIERVCCDLIYGVPGATLEDYRQTLEQFIASGVKHVSAYTLTLPPSHFLFSRLPSPEETLDQAEHIRDILRDAGLEQYEASNFARPGCESVHNSNYWSGAPYLGVGLSAHSYDGLNRRWINSKNMNNYNDLINEGRKPVESSELLTTEQKIIEFFLTRLRNVSGFQFDDFKLRTGIDFPPEKLAILRKFEADGYGQVLENTWKPTFLGLMLADSLAEKII